MSDDTTAVAPETGASDDSSEQNQTETVEALKAKLDSYKEIARKNEKRAKENAEAARELEEIKQSQMTDAERISRLEDKAKQAIDSVPSLVADALRSHLVELHQIDTEDAELFLTATDPELLLKQVARFVGKSDQKSTGNHVPVEGRTPNPAKGSTGERFAEFAESFFTR